MPGPISLHLLCKALRYDKNGPGTQMSFRGRQSKIPAPQHVAVSEQAGVAAVKELSRFSLWLWLFFEYSWLGFRGSLNVCVERNSPKTFF